MLLGFPSIMLNRQVAAQYAALRRIEMRPCDYCGGGWTKEKTWSDFARKYLIRPASKCKHCGAGRNQSTRR